MFLAICTECIFLSSFCNSEITPIQGPRTSKVGTYKPSSYSKFLGAWWWRTGVGHLCNRLQVSSLALRKTKEKKMFSKFYVILAFHKSDHICPSYVFFTFSEDILAIHKLILLALKIVYVQHNLNLCFGANNQCVAARDNGLNKIHLTLQHEEMQIQSPRLTGT